MNKNHKAKQNKNQSKQNKIKIKKNGYLRDINPEVLKKLNDPTLTQQQVISMMTTLGTKQIATFAGCQEELKLLQENRYAILKIVAKMKIKNELKEAQEVKKCLSKFRKTSNPNNLDKINALVQYLNKIVPNNKINSNTKITRGTREKRALKGINNNNKTGIREQQLPQIKEEEEVQQNLTKNEESQKSEQEPERDNNNKNIFFGGQIPNLDIITQQLKRELSERAESAYESRSQVSFSETLEILKEEDIKNNNNNLKAEDQQVQLKGTEQTQDRNKPDMSQDAQTVRATRQMGSSQAKTSPESVCEHDLADLESLVSSLTINQPHTPERMLQLLSQSTHLKISLSLIDKNLFYEQFKKFTTISYVDYMKKHTLLLINTPDGQPYKNLQDTEFYNIRTCARGILEDQQRMTTNFEQAKKRVKKIKKKIRKALGQLSPTLQQHYGDRLTNLSAQIDKILSNETIQNSSKPFL